MKLISSLVSVALSATLFYSATTIAQSNGNALPNIGISGFSALSIDKEKRLGRLFMKQARSRLPIAYDPVLNEYINNLGNRLVAHADDVNFPFKFFIVNDKSINAFAFFGGHIGVHTGLIELADTESEVASVLGHEIAHVTQRHLARRLESQSKSGPVTLAGLIGSILLAAVSPQAAMAALTVTQASSAQSSINFTRGNEKEADRIGMQILNHSGYDPYGAPSFMAKMSAKFRYLSKPPAILLTHPLPESRITDTRLRAQQYPKKYLSNNLDFALAKTRITARYHLKSDAAVDHYTSLVNKSPLPQNLYGLALALSDSGKAIQAKPILNQLLAADPNNLFYLDTYTDVLSQTKEFKSLLSSLEQHYQLKPNNPVITLNYASAAIKANNIELATRLLKYYLIRYPEDYLATTLLAEAYSKEQNKAKYHEYQAYSYALRAAYNQAISQINLSLNYLEDEKDRLDIKRLEAKLAQYRFQIKTLKEM